MTTRPHEGAAPAAPNGYAWRRARGLLTIRDHVRIYQARRYPRAILGRLPLPADLLPCWLEVRP